MERCIEILEILGLLCIAPGLGPKSLQPPSCAAAPRAQLEAALLPLGTKKPQPKRPISSHAIIS